MTGPSGTEGAVFGGLTLDEIRTFVDGYARGSLGSGVSRVRFRAGRIDAVWGVDLVDGRAVVVKTHRPPADVEALSAARDAQRLLVAEGFPCPAPLSGPDLVDGRVVSAETLVSGTTPDGRLPANRRLLADGLATHVRLLQARPDLVGRAGPGPAWCRYGEGPWPVPHDTLVDLEVEVPGYTWLDRFARRAADQVLEHRAGSPVVVGHADWYAGNTAVRDGRLVAYDWELVADTEAVVAGFAAACFAARQTSAGGLSTPEDVAAFLQDYESARGARWSADEQRAAVAAAAWICAFNARWQVALLAHDLSDDPGSVLRLQQRGDDYLRLRW